MDLSYWKATSKLNVRKNVYHFGYFNEGVSYIE